MFHYSSVRSFYFWKLGWTQGPDLWLTVLGTCTTCSATVPLAWTEKGGARRGGAFTVVKRWTIFKLRLSWGIFLPYVCCGGANLAEKTPRWRNDINGGARRGGAIWKKVARAQHWWLKKISFGSATVAYSFYCLTPAAVSFLCYLIVDTVLRIRNDLFRIQIWVFLVQDPTHIISAYFEII